MSERSGGGDFELLFSDRPLVSFLDQTLEEDFFNKSNAEIQSEEGGSEEISLLNSNC